MKLTTFLRDFVLIRFWEILKKNTLKFGKEFHEIYIFFPEMADTLSEWNKGELDSFLIEISANILKYKDTDGLPLVEKIRDAAGQKGIY